MIRGIHAPPPSALNKSRAVRRLVRGHQSAPSAVAHRGPHTYKRTHCTRLLVQLSSDTRGLGSGPHANNASASAKFSVCNCSGAQVALRLAPTNAASPHNSTGSMPLSRKSRIGEEHRGATHRTGLYSRLQLVCDQVHRSRQAAYNTTPFGASLFSLPTSHFYRTGAAHAKPCGSCLPDRHAARGS